MIIKTHAEIVFKSLGLPFSQIEIFLAANPYIIRLKKSKKRVYFAILIDKMSKYIFSQ